MMKVEQFMKKHRINGLYSTRNGPRLYIEAVRRRRGLTTAKFTAGYVQKAYIDLRAYKPVVETTGPDKRRCDEMTADLIERLLPVARLARILKIKHQ